MSGADLPEDVVRKYLEAGRIAAQVLNEAVRLVEPGVRLIDIVEYVEKRIRELGGEPAFPCNISVNSVAAHYTPQIGDDTTIPEGAVVKIDVGVHVDGYIADTAATVSLDPAYEPLLDAARDALENALAVVGPGVKFSEVGKVVEKAIRARGYNPIVDLSGHSLARYRIHAGDSIPNFHDPYTRGRFTPGRAYAIEPFATNGVGRVTSLDLVTIYAYTGLPPRRKKLGETEKKVLDEVVKRFRTLPFTERWLADIAPLDQLRQALTRLARRGLLHAYPVLVEASNGIVAQFEHTVLVLRDQVLVTTMKK